MFYTQVLGLSGLITGLVLALSLVWDGITDPLVGSWSDQLRSRYGRRHPFMVYSTLPSLRHYMADVAQTFRNKSFRTILNYEIAAASGWGSVSTLNVLVGTYVFEFSAEQMAIVLAAPSLAAVLLLAVFLKPLSQRWQKPQLLRGALWGLFLNTLWLLPLKLAGLLPANGTHSILLLNLLSSTLFMFFFLLRMTNSMSIVADITDQHELEQGERKEGGFFSVMTFTIKISTLVGPLYGGIVLDVIGLSRQDLPGEVAQPVLEGLMVAVRLIGRPTLAIALRYAYKVDISREQVESTQNLLGDREASAYAWETKK